MASPTERIRVGWATVLVAVILALGVGVGVGFVLGRAMQPAGSSAEAEPLVQSGDLTPPVAPDSYGWSGPVEVFYPIPYASPPELTFPLPPQSFQVKAQRADGFKVEILRCGTEHAPTWRAKGLPEARGR
jgi:hypothetical protein